ncbi:MAG: amino acid carrier protein, partial [Bacteroidetes bacterium]
MKQKVFLLIIASFLISNTNSFSQTQNDTITKNNEIKSETFSQKINTFFTPVVKQMGKILFWDPFEATGVYDPIVYDNNHKPVIDKNGEVKKTHIPFVVIWLVLGALFFTFFMKFINIRGAKIAIDLIRGKYDDQKQKGQISHFQALTTALSATIGLGNIAGVAIAISLGGPGATFWMIIAGLLGMSSKFVECSLAVKYRKIDKNGRVSGGPMYYLSQALANYHLPITGKFLAFIFAL